MASGSVACLFRTLPLERGSPWHEDWDGPVLACSRPLLHTEIIPAPVGSMYVWFLQGCGLTGQSPSAGPVTAAPALALPSAHADSAPAPHAGVPLSSPLPTPWHLFEGSRALGISQLMDDSVVCLHFLFKRDGQNKGTPDWRPPESEQTLLGCHVPSPLPLGMPPALLLPMAPEITKLA